MNGSSRRDVLGMGVLGAIAAALPFGLSGCATSRGQTGERANAKRRLARVAHITDSHTQAERGGFEGTCAMWEHLNALRDKPDLVLHGGDIVFDVFAKNKAKSQEQWDLYLQSMRAHNKLPVYHALGNHDIWGWDKKASETTGAETSWGKAWAVDLLGMPGAYYAFEARGVKFIVLDTVQPRGEAGYEGGLGDAQFEWLQGELASAKLPVVILTHIPAVHASSVLVDARLNNDKNWITGGGASLMDRVQVVNLISRHRNISAVLSGHIHMVERVDYAGTSWINSGAVCGSWWQSQQKSREFLADRRNDKTMLERPDRAMPGYGLLDVYSDGSIGWEYVEWGWQPTA
ncbi:MAG TPA: metallophosphoesterase [Phycisphaerales bacterium]|nr:metallophosphoesterase [Phycisphaerales bacterium]